MVAASRFIAAANCSFILGLCLCAAGCSDGTTTGDDTSSIGANRSSTGDGLDRSVSDNGTSSTTDGTENSRVNAPMPIDLLTVETGVSDDAPLAGEQIQVFCTVQGLAQGQASPATHWAIVHEPSEVNHEPVVEGDMIIFESSGEYAVRCTIDETSWSDPTATKIHVHPAAALEVETVVDPDLMQAGTQATVSCSGVDMYGNVVEENWQVNVTPGGDSPGDEEGLAYGNYTLSATLVGTYEVACQQGDLASDKSPVIVEVTHGVPYRLAAYLESDTIIAGHSTMLTCRSEDKWGNEVPDLPMSVELPSALSLVGFDVTSTVTGLYSVKCVPAGLDWTTFVITPASLEVIPDAPVSLELSFSPPKPFFTTFELVTLLAVTRDQYDNPIPALELEDVEVSAPLGDYVATTPTTFIFFFDGTYELLARLKAYPYIFSTIDILIDGAPPTVTVTQPLRGATLQGYKPSVTVKGLANDTIGGVGQILVNGQQATLNDDGTWSTIIIPKWGLNVLEIEAEDINGKSTRTVQSFYFAEKYHAMEPTAVYLPDGIKAWLDKNFIDDGIHNPNNPDDLATIFEGVLATLDLSALLESDEDAGDGYHLELNNLYFDAPKIWLKPFDGGLQVTVVLKNLHIGVALVGKCEVLGIDLCPDFSGSVSVDVVSGVLDLFVSAEEGVMDLYLDNTVVNLAGLDIDINGILGWLFDFIIDFVTTLFVDDIEDMVEEELHGALGPSLSEVFDALAISDAFEIPSVIEGEPDVSVAFDSKLWNLNFTSDGGRLGLATRFATAKKVPQTIHGSIARGTCLKGYPTHWNVPGLSEYEAAIHDDFVNQLLSTLWYAGSFNIEIDESTLAGDDGSGESGPELGNISLPVDSISIKTTALLPPILNGCDQAGLMKLQIGDLYIEISVESPIFEEDVAQIGMFVSAELITEFTVMDTDEGNAIGLVLHDIDQLHFDWEFVPILFQGAEEELEVLLVEEIIKPALADLMGEPFGIFTLPEFDFGDMSTIFPSGAVLKPELDDLSHQHGHTLVQGYFE